MNVNPLEYIVDNSVLVEAYLHPLSLMDIYTAEPIHRNGSGNGG